jgi:hypothetical protein
LQPGYHALIQAVPRKPELNGELVIVGKFKPERGRWKVTIPSSGEAMAAKAEQLRRIDRDTFIYTPPHMKGTGLRLPLCCTFDMCVP